MEVPSPGFIPIPHFNWLNQLHDGQLRKVNLSFSFQPKAFLLHISWDKGIKQIYEFPLSPAVANADFTPIEWYSLHRDRTGLSQRRKPPQLQSIVKEYDSEIREFLRKVAWVFGVVRDERTITDYVPSNTALLYEKALEEFREIDKINSEMTVSESGTMRPSFVNETPLLHKLFARNWPQLFQEADALLKEDQPAVSPVNRVVLHGLSGNMVALRKELSSSRSTTPRCPSNFFLGSFLHAISHHRAAAAFHKRGLAKQISPNHVQIAMEIGKCFLELEEKEESEKWILLAVQLAPRDQETLLRAIEALRLSQSFNSLESVLAQVFRTDPRNRDIAVQLANTYLWKGDYARARIIQEQSLWLHSDDPACKKVAAILEYLSGNTNEARKLFDQLLASDPNDTEATLWLTELLMREGLVELATPLLRKAQQKETTAANVIISYIHRVQTTQPDVRDDYYAILANLVSIMGNKEPFVAAGKSDQELIDFGFRILKQLRGNRTSTLTFVPEDQLNRTPDSVELKLFSFEGSDSRKESRNLCSETIRKLRTHSAEEVMEIFHHLVSEASTPHPNFYRGELYLWLGMWEEAYKDFEEGTEKYYKTRWSFVGKAAVHIMKGEYEQVEEHLAKLRFSFKPLAAATTFVYLGEMHRRQGRYEEAEKLLTDAIAAKPGRIAARMNLAITYLHQDRADEARYIFDDLLKHFPRIFWDALDGDIEQWPPRFEDMVSLFDTVLLMMRGNRSSHLVTYFDHHGQFRILQNCEKLGVITEQNAHYIGSALASRLSQHTFGTDNG